MDIEFHYYITYIIAVWAGFKAEDAYIIAYSSQYTDDNNTVYVINEGSPDAYSNYISQTMNIFRPQRDFMRIYPVFHFMPGTVEEIASDATRRRDGKLHLMNTTPDNLNSRHFITSALYSGNLYRIGIATHMYADTFAHQNFVGFDDSFNGIKGLFEKIIPDVGHADAKRKPDMPALVWEDERLIPSHSEIDNKKRFLEAARCIYKKYAAYLHNPNDGQDLLCAIDKAIGDYEGDEEDRIERYKAIAGAGFIDYDDRQWFNDAVYLMNEEALYSGDHSIVGSEEALVWRENCKDSHWFKFQEAVKVHQWSAMDTVIAPIFVKMEFKGL